MAKARQAGSAPMTMEDLAALAGVSKITVSRALRDSPLVRESVRERIKALSFEHGYRVNAAARSLRTRRAHSITAAMETAGTSCVQGSENTTSEDAPFRPPYMTDERMMKRDPKNSINTLSITERQ